MKLPLNYLHFFIFISLIFIGCKTDKNKNETTKDTYDLVIKNGRVIDPETNTDKILNLGINGGSIVKITTEVFASVTLRSIALS